MILRKDILQSETLDPHALGIVININGDLVDADAVCSCAQWALDGITSDSPQELAADIIEMWEAHRHLAWKAEGH